MIEAQARIRVMPDLKEIASVSRASWLGGMFETGGMVSMAIENWTNRPGYESTYPYIARNTSPQRVVILESFLGGRHQIQKENSWRWELKGQRAIDAALTMTPFSPSHKSVIKVFRQLEKEDSMSRKVEIVRSFRDNGLRLDTVTEAQYLRLLQNPAFAAGIFDAIGSVYTTTSRPIRTQIESTNEPLIKAINRRFGGSMHVRVKPGTPVSLRETSWITKNSSFEWELGIEKSLEFLQLIAPHVQLAKAEVAQALRQAA